MLEDGSINPGQMTSFNHYALGSVCAFLHETVGGLSPLEPGWQKALIHPRPGGTVRSAKTSYDSPYGPYSVEWQVDEGGKMSTKISVPPNCTAKVVLPGVQKEVGSGTYEFEGKWEGEADWPPKIFGGPQGLGVADHYVP